MELKIIGKRGQIRVSNLVTPHTGHRLRVNIDGRYHQEQVPGKSSYFYQLLEFERRIREESSSSDLQQSVAKMKLIDSIYMAAGLSPRGIH